MATGDERDRLARRTARAIYQRVVTTPLLAVFTILASTLATFADRVVALFDLGGDVAAAPIAMVTDFGTRALAVAARETALEVAELEALAFVAAVALGGGTLYVVAWEVRLFGGN